MVLFGMVGFVKYKQVDLVHPDKGVDQALVKDLRCADDDHVIDEMLLPGFLLQTI
jgi:hypothetical protein